MTPTTPIMSQRFEEWLDLNSQNECWPPTLESFQRFCTDTSEGRCIDSGAALSVAATAAAWREYSMHGFSVVSVDGAVSRC